MKLPIDVAVKRGDDTIEVAIVSLDENDEPVTDEFSFPCPIALLLASLINKHG